MVLKIIIAGAGIAGLSAAIGLARDGHSVDVCERRYDDDGEEESTGGVQLQPNAVKILRNWGTLDLVDDLTQDSLGIDLRTKDGETLQLIDMQIRGGVRYGKRGLFKNALQKYALQCGARIHRGRQVVDVEESAASATVIFADGKRESADLVLGADGTGSHIRRSLFPSFRPTTLDQCVFQIAVPLRFMESSPETKALLRNSPATVVHISPGRYIVSSPVLDAEIYDLQLFDLDYPVSRDPHPDIITGRMEDMVYVRNRFADFEAGITKAVKAATSLWKWRLRQVEGIPSWSSPHGRILLIGDSCHGIVPHSGQGAAMGIEDGALIAELLAKSTPGMDIKFITKTFEKIRRPRCDLVRKFAKAQGDGWTTEDPQKQQRRDEKLRQPWPAGVDVQADSSASFLSPQFQKWLDDYDVHEEASKVMRQMQSRL
jgi:salicylate hydroxylase